MVDMATWYTADHHFGHENIIRLCDRPFADAEEMDAALVEEWNRCVRPGDTVWVLGDVALSTKKLGPVGLLNGRKILVAGNHDACWEGHKRWRRHVQVYRDAGFDDVVTEGERNAHQLQNGRVVRLAHLPYERDFHEEEDRYAERRPVDDGVPLLCGHVHDRWKLSGRQINVGVDVWDYRPVPEQLVMDLLSGELSGEQTREQIGEHAS
jgi:calcineurin-like phosphoesterase family protein